MPWMPGRNGLGVRSQKMVQHMQQRTDVVAVAAPLRVENVVDDHPANLFRAMALMDEVLRVSDSRHLRHVLMLGDGKDFLLRQIT